MTQPGTEKQEQPQRFENYPFSPKPNDPKEVGERALALVSDSALAADAVETYPSKGTSVEVFDSEIERWAAEAKKALAEKYEKYGCTEEDFKLVSFVDKDGLESHAVVYAAGRGLDLGNPRKPYDRARSWDSIMKARSGRHMVVIDGKKYDARAGMTSDLYLKMHNDAADNKVSFDGYNDQLRRPNKYDTYPYPDERENRPRPVYTLMTGDSLDADGKATTCTGGVNIKSDQTPTDDSSYSLRFRPAVKLAVELR